MQLNFEKAVRPHVGLLATHCIIGRSQIPAMLKPNLPDNHFYLIMMS